MKKPLLIILIIILFGFIVNLVFRSTIESIEKRNDEEAQKLFSIFTDTIPPEFAALFDSSTSKKIKVISSFNSDEAEYPIVILEYQKEYEIIIFKKNFDTANNTIYDFLKVQKPLKFNSLNTRSYVALEGVVDIMFSKQKDKKSLDSVLVTMPEYCDMLEIMANQNSSAFLINNCNKFNVYCDFQKNPDIIFEIKNPIYIKKPSNFGLILKENKHFVYLLFVLPKESNATPISIELVKNIL